MEMGIFAQTVATVRSTAVPNFSPPHSDSLLPMSRNVVPTLQSDPADFTYAVYYTHAHFLIRTHARTHEPRVDAKTTGNPFAGQQPLPDFDIKM